MTLQTELVRAERLKMHRINEDFSYGEPWDDERDQQLLGLVRSGHTRAEIAAITGRTKEAIKARGQLLNLRFTRDTFGGTHKTTYDRPTYEGRKEQESRDRSFIRALAVAMYRGDHLPGASNVG